MKVILLYPPDRRIPTVPYSALPTLAAPLRAAGHEVVIRDLAADVFHHLTTPERLESYYDFVLQRLQELEAKDQLTAEERGMYRGVAAFKTGKKESLLRCQENIAVFRNAETFYQPELFNRAFDETWNVIRILYAASPMFNPYSYTYMDDLLAAMQTSLGDPISDALQEGVLDRIVAEKPDLVGVTLPFSIQVFDTLKVLHALKQRLPEAKLVIGGQTVNDFQTTLFADTRLFQVLDYAIHGEGENAILQLCEVLEGKRTPEEVVNLYWEENGKVRKSALPDDIVDLNLQPTPDFEGIDFGQYLIPEPIVNFQTSRGCYYGKCAFCGDAFRRNFRMRKPTLVYEDVKTIHETFGVKQFMFWDSLAPPKTLRNLAKMIKADGLPVTWFAETKFEKPYLHPNMFSTLEEGGCRFLQFGMESADEGILDAMDKGNSVETVCEIQDLMKPTKVGCGVSYFVGFPGETVETVRKTFQFIIDRRDKIQLQAYAGKFLLGRDTIVYEDPERFGIEVIRHPDGDIDYQHKDGSAHPDWSDLDRQLWVRGDTHIITYSAQLFYAAHHPERFFEVIGMGRFGPFGWQVPDLENTRVRKGQNVSYGRFAYDWIDESDTDALKRTPTTVALVPRSGNNLRLSDAQVKIFDLADGSSTCGALAEKLGRSFADLEQDFHQLIDEGVLTVPWEEMPPPLSQRQEVETSALP